LARRSAGLLGARLSYRLPPWLYRGGIVVIGVALTTLIFFGELAACDISNKAVRGLCIDLFPL